MGSGPWTPEEDQIAAMMWRNGEGAGAIAKAVGRSRNSVVSRMHRMRVPTPNSPNASGLPKYDPYIAAEAYNRTYSEKLKARDALAVARGEKKPKRVYIMRNDRRSVEKRIADHEHYIRVSAAGGRARAMMIDALQRKVYHPLRDNPRLLEVLRR